MIERIDSLDRLDALAPAWDALHARCGGANLFVTHLWVRTWVSHFADDGFCAVVRRTDSGALSAAAAFVRLGQSWSVFHLHSYLPEVMRAPGTPPAIADGLRALTADGDARSVHMEIAAEAGAQAELARGCRQARCVWIDAEPHPLRSIDTSTSFDDYLHAIGKKSRQELRRKDRRMTRDMPAATLVHMVGPAAAATADATIAAVERESWKARAGTAIVSSDREHRFYRSLLEWSHPASVAHTFALRDGDDAIAHVTGVVNDGVYYALKTSYRETYAPVGPGQVLFLRLVRELCATDSGVRRIELLGSDSRWKREVATSEQQRRRFDIYPRSIASTLRVFARRQVKPAIKRVVERDDRLRRAWDRAKRLRQRLERFRQE